MVGKIGLENEGVTDLRILCVIDFSEESKEVLLQSIRLAEMYDRSLTVLYPYRLTQLNHKNENPSELKKNIDSDALQNFNRLTGEVLKRSGISYEFRAEVGFVNDRVHAYSKQNKVGIIVMSKKMVGANKDTFSDLLNQLSVPLLILP